MNATQISDEIYNILEQADTQIMDMLLRADLETLKEMLALENVPDQYLDQLEMVIDDKE